MVKYNIYEALLYKNKKFILAFSYTPGFNPSNIIEDISKTFNLKVIKLECSDISNCNYDKLNNDVQKLLDENDFKLKSSYERGYYGIGILIHGFNFFPDKLNFKINLQLHFALSKSMYLLNSSNTVEQYDNFKKYLDTNKINKYYNIKSEPTLEFNDSVFNKIINYIEFKVYNKEDQQLYTTAYKKQQLKPINESTDKSKESTESTESTESKESTEISNISNIYEITNNIMNIPDINELTDSIQ